jgi:hypothetical protein
MRAFGSFDTVRTEFGCIRHYSWSKYIVWKHPPGLWENLSCPTSSALRSPVSEPPTTYLRGKAVGVCTNESLWKESRKGWCNTERRTQNLQNVAVFPPITRATVSTSTVHRQQSSVCVSDFKMSATYVSVLLPKRCNRVAFFLCLYRNGSLGRFNLVS